LEYPTLKSIIEGLLFVAGDEGLDVHTLADITEQDMKQVKEGVKELQEEYKASGRGMQIIQTSGAFRMATLPDHAIYFERMATSPTRAGLSQAGLETLSIIVYRQPITRVEIEEIRGVKTDRALQSLVGKGLIHEVGRAEAVGRPILYGTTKVFLDYFGLNHLKDLPDTTSFETEYNLEEETRLLFERLEGRQLTIDDLA
jgi:segregation and condensation protein B